MCLCQLPYVRGGIGFVLGLVGEEDGDEVRGDIYGVHSRGRRQQAVLCRIQKPQEGSQTLLRMQQHLEGVR
ncbi:unnamed protein product [Cuscuta campestris]|uniref:Uncharacterized protein n=1 Tax=Cuscuta campestris TaxID=132261 RepID=A0A484KBR4_9ASTE|nr:unnamed protein product [Cuscuta campestris]